jgi:ParB-like chromosome segregation protein Spo0J
MSLDALTVSSTIQPREAIDGDTVARFARAMRWDTERELVVDGRGNAFAPLEVVTDGETAWVVDGHHRALAAREAALEHFQAVCHEGDVRDAIARSLSANVREKRRRTNTDKRRNITRALSDAEWCTWSDARVARLCAVSTPTVGKVRRQLEADGVIAAQEVRHGADGRLYPRASSQRSAAGAASARVRKKRSVNRSKRRNARDPFTRAARFEGVDALLAARSEGDALIDALLVDSEAAAPFTALSEHLPALLSEQGVVIAPNSPALPDVMTTLSARLSYRGCFFAKASSRTYHVWSAHELDVPASGRRLANMLRALPSRSRHLVVIS